VYESTLLECVLRLFCDNIFSNVNETQKFVLINYNFSVLSSFLFVYESTLLECCFLRLFCDNREKTELSKLQVAISRTLTEPQLRAVYRCIRHRGRCEAAYKTHFRDRL